MTNQEQMMIEAGRIRLQNATQKANNKGRAYQTAPARRIMAGGIGEAGSLERFADELQSFLYVAERKPGKSHRLAAVLKQIPNPYVVAYLTVKVAFNAIIEHKDLTRTAVLVGRELEDEIRFSTFAKENPAFWNKLEQDLNRREPNIERRRGILRNEMKKGAETQPSLAWTTWTEGERCAVGIKCLELLQTATLGMFGDEREGLIRIKTIREKGKTVGKIQLPASALAWVHDFLANGGKFNPMYLPMTEPPMNWDNPVAGGYPFSEDGMRGLRLVKVYSSETARTYFPLLNQMPERLRTVYAALNAVQNTAWKINRPVYEVMVQAKDAGLSVGKAPRCIAWKNKAEVEAQMPLPVKPVDIATNKDALSAWKIKAKEVYTQRAVTESQSLQHIQLMSLAASYLDAPAIYFPMQLDFRGRMYAVPSNLNPQGSDPAKGLLTFANGKKLGEQGLRWLLIHTANMHGEDKISLDDRERWTLDHLAEIQGYAADPFANRGWMDADKGEKAWEFLAACFEVAEAYALPEPSEFVSSLPIMVDGTCNGLQHFSAMLLDEQGAKAVNLAPSAVPQDIYQTVAERVKVRLREDNSDMAKAWLAWGFDRKATKRAVMIVPYAGTQFAAREYTLDYVQSRANCPFEGDARKAAANFFAQHVWAAIAETVVSAREVMNWLRAVAKVASRAQRSIRWYTPVGFPVEQAYREAEQFQVDTRVGDSIRYMPALRRETLTFDHRRAEQGISPNFIHSLDAACLMLTVVRAQEEGITSFAMVHDSYGVVAADMDTLYHGLRQAFVDIYQTDVMQEFYLSATAGLRAEDLAKIPAAPKKGTFQLELVKESPYFFA